MSRNKNNETEQSSTAETNETAKEKVQGTLEAVGTAFSGLAGWLLRVFALLLILYPIAASVTDALPMPSLNPEQVVFLAVYFVSILVFYLPAAKGISMIWQPEKEVVARIDASSQSVLNAWSASPEKVDEMVVEDGVVRSKIVEGHITHLVNEFDPETNTAKAPREMEIPDWELWGEKKAIERQRHRNNIFAEFGKQLFIRLPALGQQLEANYWDKMSKNQVEKELVEPESFLNSIEEELPDLDDETDVMDEMRAAMDQNQPVGGVEDE